MTGVVVTVTPTIQDGTVVRWYRSEIAAERRMVMISASRNGVAIGEHLSNGEVPPETLAAAEAAHAELRANRDADMSVYATHRRTNSPWAPLVPVREGEPADG